ncbi:MAG: hypothetical protein MUC67_00400 [Acidobacteria bacterium]|nr:hypothetical protein [Acidobacteriota bacterium]
MRRVGRSLRGSASRLLVVAAGLALGTSLAAEESGARRSLLDTPHPGRLTALGLFQHGATALREGRPDQAEPLLERAVAADPLSAPSWVALAAARIEICDLAGARFAALAATRVAVAPEESGAAREASRRSAEASCTPPPVRAPSASARAEATVAERPADYRAWAEAAAARRARGDLSLAVFEEEQALELGGEPAIRRMKLTQDLEQLGLWRAALELLAEEAGEDARERREQLAVRLSATEPEAERIAASLAAGKGWTEAAARAGLTELALAALAADPGESPERVGDRLAELLGIPAPAIVEGRWGRATLRAGWSPAQAPFQGPGSPPAALLRRFPGDTQLAVCDPGRAWSGDPEATERFAREHLFAGGEPRPEGPPEACDPAPPGSRCEVSRWQVGLGAEGRVAVRVFRLAASEPATSRELWVVGLVGDTGCGAACAAAAAESLRAQLAALSPAATPPEAPVAGPCRWPIPAALRSDRTHREREDPWRRIGIGQGLVIEVPPGVVAARVDRTFRDAAAGPDTALWLRGSFEDQSGTLVRIGDAKWAGWVDSRPLEEGAAALDPATIPPPRTDPAARRLGGADLTPARSTAGLTGEAATARFAGADFSGSWLVHRVRTGGRELEIALPIAAGEKSLAPLWVALTARPSDADAPPPPYDLARRYRVRFDRQASSRSPADPREGMLLGEGVRFLVPRGYRATLSGASADGFPVTLRNELGSLMVVTRFESGDALALGRRALEEEWGPPQEPWRAARKGRVAVVESAAFAPPEGRRAPRRAVALVDDGGAFLIRMIPGEKADPAAWAAESQLVTQSLKAR